MTGENPASRIGEIKFPVPLNLREVWPSEPFDFTPWLASNLRVLSYLGLGQLALVDTEVSIPDTGRALDILAETPTGEKVAIENQYGRADHDHLSRALAYAVGLQAEALVIVAEEHQGEFRAVAGYLNRLAERSGDDGVHVYLVEVAVESVGEYVVPRFTTAVAPNRWLEGATRSQPKGEKLTVEEFLAALPDGLRPAMSAVVEWWSAHPGSSMRFAPTSISLDRPHPSRSGRSLSHMLLWAKGGYTIQRGYLREAGIVTEDTLGEFDELVRQCFPNASWADKAYYLNVPGAPTLEAVQDFLRWTEEHALPASAA